MGLIHLTDKLPEILTILVEECAEVTQLACKIQRFGLDSYHPADPSITNKELLVGELGDLLALIDLLVAEGQISIEQIDAAKIAKILKLQRWSTIFN
jgi:NTP pyrophosphatase (non-canonical NTP hydrolase)